MTASTEKTLSQEDVNRIVKERVERERKKFGERYRGHMLEEIRDELRSLRVMVAAVKDELETL